VVTALGVLYSWVLKPWHMQWGATTDEAQRPMPGDDLIPGAGQATRAITIHARGSTYNVWPCTPLAMNAP